MSTVYLNGDYLPMSEARISPMDRGFLFGEGIYEVIPSYNGQLVGFGPHLARMQYGLDAIEIQLQLDRNQWRDIAAQLIARNGGGNLGLYFQISRGADTKRQHTYPTNISPTIFAFAYEIPALPSADKRTTKPYKVATAEDLRWQRCNIKSTSLLGNIMHYQQGHTDGHDETVLYNHRHELTEAASCNVYVIKNGIVATPLLDQQKLPGISRYMLLDILRSDGHIPVEERVVTLNELRQADEVWLSSSTRDIVPVIAVDDHPVADGKAGDVWLAAQTLYSARKFEF
jgi:D-alanine transaminase